VTGDHPENLESARSRGWCESGLTVRIDSLP